MTARRDLKRRVRERQAQTGESYVTALRHVLDQRPSPDRAEPDETRPEGRLAFPVVEMTDISDEASRFGIRTRLLMAPELVGTVDSTSLVLQLRNALLATASDLALGVMRDAVLGGHLPPPVEPRGVKTQVAVSFGDRQFVARVRAGIGGVSDSGRMLALTIQGHHTSQLVVFLLWQVPPAHVWRQPSLLAMAASNLGGHPLLAWGFP
jgi:hypothetical protein